MEHLLSKALPLITDTSTKHVRFLYGRIAWDSRLIGITGARGTGKSTLILQRIKQQFPEGKEALYLTLDDLHFATHTLVETIEYFRLKGITNFFLDEVHKYAGWAREIKNIYDFYRDVHIVFTGSSIVEIRKQDVDLSRRAVIYSLPGLSFREFLAFSGHAEFPAISLNEILSNHTAIATELLQQFKPYRHFEDYSDHGYYPFFLEELSTFHSRLEQVVKLVIETDLQFIEGFNPQNIRKVFRLLGILASYVPFKPNLSKMSGDTGIYRTTLLHYLHYLEQAQLITLLSASNKVGNLNKPDKILLQNPNLFYTLVPGSVNTGSLRETFVLSHLLVNYQVELPPKGDFLIDGNYTIEVGGKNKSDSQIRGLENAFVAADNIEVGAFNKIPLWLFGFLY